MIYGFVGSVFGSLRVPVRGTGKTMAMTYWMYHDSIHEDFAGYSVYTNYKTTFSTCLDMKDIASMIFDGELDHVLLGIDEIQKYIENIGKNKYSEFMGELVNESRKDDVEIYFTTQRFKNLLLRFREQVDRIIWMKKYHSDSHDYCDDDKCRRNHFIMCYDYDPLEGSEYFGSIDCVKWGTLYDTKQRIRVETER